MIIRILSIVIGFLMLYSCSHQSEKDNEAVVLDVGVQQAKTELNFVGHWLYQAKREDMVRELANEFEFLNQDCKVNLKFPEEVYYSRDKANSEEAFVSEQLLSAKPSFDILRINDQYSSIAFYMKDKDWAKKYLVDFSEYPEFINNTKPELVNDEAKAKWNGIIPGPYLEGYNYSIWYNRNLAKEMGIEVKQFGMTFEDLLGYVKAIDAFNKSHNTNIIPIQECTDWTTIHLIALRLIISEIGNLDECMRDSYNDKKLSAYYKALQALEELSKYNAYSKSWKQHTFLETLNYPLTHKSFFYVNASWMYNYWQKIDNGELKDMVPAELPVFKPSDVYFGGYSIMWAVPKNAPNKEKAVKFLLAMTQPDVAEKWSRYTKCPTGLKGTITNVSFGVDHFEEFTSTINAKYGSKKLSFNYLDNYIVLGASMRNVNVHAIDVATGTMTAEEAMADIRRQLRASR
ncbi:MAG TPA: ABC transporter substrate-binding protein [Bacteroidales bacterium]|nr:ABC transporter substrate-binding protein [Bacteroidales bacterium]